MPWRNLFEDLFTLIHLGGIAALVAMLFHAGLRDGFGRRCVGEATAKDLAYVRIAACAVMLIYVGTEELSEYARLGPAMMTPPGFAAELSGTLDWFLSSAARLDALTWTIVALALCGLLGLGTRIVLPVLVVVYLLYAALLRSCGKSFHEGYLVWYVLMVLCFLPCADAWSVDARWRKREPPAGTAYGWHVWACFAAASVPYVQLAFSKLALGGPLWFDGRSLRNYVLTDNLNLPAHGLDLGLSMVDAPTFLWTVAAAIGLATELLYPLVLFVPRFRVPLALAVIGLHAGVWLGQNAFFPDAVMIPAIFFLPSVVERWRRR